MSDRTKRRVLFAFTVGAWLAVAYFAVSLVEPQLAEADDVTDRVGLTVSCSIAASLTCAVVVVTLVGAILRQMPALRAVYSVGVDHGSRPLLRSVNCDADVVQLRAQHHADN